MNTIIVELAPHPDHVSPSEARPVINAFAEAFINELPPGPVPWTAQPDLPNRRVTISFDPTYPIVTPTGPLDGSATDLLFAAVMRAGRAVGRRIWNDPEFSIGYRLGSPEEAN